MKGFRYLMRDFTAAAVTEHLRSQAEDRDGPPDLTPKELELIRYICRGSYDWGACLAERPVPEPSG